MIRLSIAYAHRIIERVHKLRLASVVPVAMIGCLIRCRMTMGLKLVELASIVGLANIVVAVVVVVVAVGVALFEP